MIAELSWPEFLRQFPKVELHYHLLGGVRLQTMLELAKAAGVPLDESEAQTYYRAYAAPGRPMKGGIAALDFLYPLLRTPADFARVAREVAEDAAATGIRYLETFWNPSDVSLGYAEATDALIAAFAEAERQYGLVTRLIPSINREKSPEEAVAMVEMVIANPRAEVLGIGIDYKENDAPVEHFWKAYHLARANGLRLTAHCSEFGLHWRNVETGIDLIGVDRIDHGYSVIDNPELARRCAAMGLPFTVVPSNTYFLRQWPDPAEWREKHPIREMARLGLCLVPGTDDWHIHNTNGAECYRVMVEEFGFDLDGVRRMLCNGIDAAWASDEHKTRWKRDWCAEFDSLRARLHTEPTGSISY